MKLSTDLQSELATWILGATVVGALSAGAYGLVGWLGVGLLGLFGLFVSVQVDLHSGHAVIHSGHGSSAVRMYAKQREAQASQSSPEQKMAVAAEREKRSRTLYLINTVFIAMTGFGFGLFVFHQLP